MNILLQYVGYIERRKNEIRREKIIVTGGARGMGREAVKKFCDEGALVVSIDLSEQKNYKNVILKRASVSNKEEITKTIDQAVKELGGLDAIYNIAGVNHFLPTLELTEEEIDLILSVNVKGVLFSCQAAFPHLKENGGVIVNFGSQAANNAGPDAVHYSASKAAVQTISHKLAYEWGKYGIRVNCVLPSAWTPLFEQTVLQGQKVTPELKATVQEGMKEVFPLGYLGDPYEDIAPVLVFLASEDSKYITAQAIAVNGGSSFVR